MRRLFIGMEITLYVLYNNLNNTSDFYRILTRYI